jgi:hypothetical protein
MKDPYFRGRQVEMNKLPQKNTRKKRWGSMTAAGTETIEFQAVSLDGKAVP